MRVIVRLSVAALSIAFVASLAAVAPSSGVLAQADQPQEVMKQVALTEKQIQAFLAAKKEIDAVLEKLPEGASDQPDPSVMAKLDGIAKKYKFAGYAEYDTVSGNIGLVMSGFDPETQKYVGPEAVIKKQLAEVQADKTMPAKDKKEALEQLAAALKTATPVQFPANIALVGKYYVKLNEAMSQD